MRFYLPRGGSSRAAFALCSICLPSTMLKPPPTRNFTLFLHLLRRDRRVDDAPGLNSTLAVVFSARLLSSRLWRRGSMSSGSCNGDFDVQKLLSTQVTGKASEREDPAGGKAALRSVCMVLCTSRVGQYRYCASQICTIRPSRRRWCQLRSGIAHCQTHDRRATCAPPPSRSASACLHARQRAHEAIQ